MPDGEREPSYQDGSESTSRDGAFTVPLIPPLPPLSLCTDSNPNTSTGCHCCACATAIVALNVEYTSRYERGKKQREKIHTTFGLCVHRATYEGEIVARICTNVRIHMRVLVIHYIVYSLRWYHHTRRVSRTRASRLWRFFREFPLRFLHVNDGCCSSSYLTDMLIHFSTAMRKKGERFM